jgi:PAS domain S-box-containing protein
MSWAALYLVSAGFIVLAHTNADAPLAYAPVAVGVGLLLVGGLRWWPLILVCEVVTSVLTYGYPYAVIPGVAVPGGLETLVVAVVIRWQRLSLTDADAALRLSVLGLGAAIGGATAGIGILRLFGSLPDSTGMWFSWWTGDATAMATLLPLVLVFTGNAGLKTGPGRARAPFLEPVVLLVLEAGIVAATALSTGVDPFFRDEIRFVWAIPVLWAAVRRDLLTTSVIIATMGAVATLVSSEITGTTDIVDRIGLQTTLIAVGLAGVSVSIAVTNRRHAMTEMQVAMAALRESEHRYATLFQRSPVIQMLVDPVTSAIVDVNAAATDFYGYGRAEFQAMTIAHLSLTDPTAIDAALREQASGRMHFVAHHRLASGDLRTVEVQTGPLTIDGRSLLHAVLRDITSEVAVRGQIARLAAAVESSADAVVTTDLDGKVTTWNAAAEHLYGYSREVAVGQFVERLVGHLSLSHSELAELVRADGIVQMGHISRINASGDVVPVDLVVTQILDEDGTLVGLSRLAHDLRQLFAEQERVRRSEALLADAARIGGVGSWEVDPATGATTWSDELYRLTGRSADNPVHPASLMELVVAEDQAVVAEAFTAGDSEGKPVAFRVVTADGVERSMEATWRVVPGAEGSLGREIGVVRDVTEERALEAQLRQAQRLESIGLLAGGVAHDFNNLLTAISGFTDLARLAAADGGSPDADLLEIQSAVERAKSLTSQLLTFGRRAIVRPRPVRLATAVGELVPLLRRLIGERIEISTEIDPTAVVVLDPGQLDQVLVNLVVNARDAMPSGGHLRVTAGPVLGGQQRYIWLEVADDGTGIPPEVVDQIFLPFFTTKERGQGTGLGLSTVQGIVVAAGGRISVSSTPGRGTTFRIELPAADAIAAEPAGPADGGPDGRPGGLVLFVEDEELVRQSGARILERAGFRVITAPDVPLALVKASRVRPDVLVTDIVLPGRTDGISLAEMLRARWPDLPVLLVTGYTDREPPAWAELLQKPFSAQDLVACVRRMVPQVEADSPPAAAVPTP